MYLVLVRNVLLQRNKIINKHIHNTGKNENVYFKFVLKTTNILIAIFLKKSFPKNKIYEIDLI